MSYEIDERAKEKLGEFIAAVSIYTEKRSFYAGETLLETAAELGPFELFLMRRMLDVLIAAHEFDRAFLGEGSWAVGEIRFHKAGVSEHFMSDTWSPIAVLAPVEHLAAIHRALNPGWKAPGEE